MRSIEHKLRNRFACKRRAGLSATAGLSYSIVVVPVYYVATITVNKE